MKDYCDSEGTHLHEKFGCLRSKGHPGDHEGSYFHGPKGCENCGAWDIHSDECETPTAMEDKTLPQFTCRWGEDGVCFAAPGWEQLVDTDWSVTANDHPGLTCSEAHERIEELEIELAEAVDNQKEWNGP